MEDFISEKRMRILHAIVDALEERQEELMAIEIANGGCTWRKATFMDIPVGQFRWIGFTVDIEQQDETRIAGSLSVLPDTSEIELLNWLRKELPLGQCPGLLEIRESMPMTNMGKIARHMLV